MDKIQTAIAKARAAREAAAASGQTAPAAAAVPTPDVAAPAPPPVQAPVTQPPVTMPPVAAEPDPPKAADATVDAAWQRLATVAPSTKQMSRNRVFTYTTGKPEVGTVAFDMLRTKVLQQMRANGWKRLAITSPGAGCGKSTLCLNLAFALSKQADLRTVVAEMDMRRPSLARTLGLKGSAGFASVLEGKSTFEEVAVRPRPNVAFGVHYGKVRNTAELLQSPTVGPALQTIETTYDPTLTIFDMPPMLVSDDTLGFMGQVDCVLLVAAAGATSLQEIDVCERDLAAQTNVLGVVLNKCRYMEKQYGYGYGYE